MRYTWIFCCSKIHTDFDITELHSRVGMHAVTWRDLFELKHMMVDIVVQILLTIHPSVTASQIFHVYLSLIVHQPLYSSMHQMGNLLRFGFKYSTVTMYVSVQRMKNHFEFNYTLYQHSLYPLWCIIVTLEMWNFEQFHHAFLLTL